MLQFTQYTICMWGDKKKQQSLLQFTQCTVCMWGDKEKQQLLSQFTQCIVCMWGDEKKHFHNPKRSRGVLYSSILTNIHFVFHSPGMLAVCTNLSNKPDLFILGLRSHCTGEGKVTTTDRLNMFDSSFCVLTTSDHLGIYINYLCYCGSMLE